jgi:hypothetical protein
MTITSSGASVASIFSPSCSCTAVYRPGGAFGLSAAFGVIGPFVPRNCPNCDSSGAEGLSTWCTKLSVHETLSFHLLLLPCFCSTHHVALSPPSSNGTKDKRDNGGTGLTTLVVTFRVEFLQPLLRRACAFLPAVLHSEMVCGRKIISSGR